MTLEGKTAVIPGASGGIGAAIARMLHARGVNLGLASRRGPDLGLDCVVARSVDVRHLEALTRLGAAGRRDHARLGGRAARLAVRRPCIARRSSARSA